MGMDVHNTYGVFKFIVMAIMLGYSSAPPKLDYLCVNSTKRRYSQNQYQEITTVNFWTQL